MSTSLCSDKLQKCKQGHSRWPLGAVEVHATSGTLAASVSVPSLSVRESGSAGATVWRCRVEGSVGFVRAVGLAGETAWHNQTRSKTAASAFARP